MPRVSEQYKDARREQILDAARRCFVRNGFHETSMQDLFAEAGLSSGAVYRYFTSKDELIIAIAEANSRDIIAMLHTVAADPSGSLGDALADVVELIAARHAETGLGGIAVQVWAEALRNPRLAEFFSDGLRQLHTELATTVGNYQAAGALPATVPADALSRLLIGTVPGFIMQLTLLGPDAAAGTAEALRALWPGPGKPGPGSTALTRS